VVADSTTTASILRFKGAARGVGMGGIIQSALLIDSVAAATKPDLEMYIFTQPPAMQADNAAWNPTDAEMLFCIGVIAFPLGSFKTAGANGIIEPSNPGQAFTCDPALTDIFGILVARNAYTPSSGEIFKILLQILQD
jgi:hypothetical protein